MNFIHAIILGVVEGVTEFLPVSSTGHLILTSALLKIQQSEFLKTFELVIQLGAILAVVVLYWKKLLTNWQTFKRVSVAFIPSVVFGLLFYKMIKTYLLGNTMVVVASLVIGGIALIVFEKLHKPTKELTTISYPHAFIIGLFQCIAFIPGVSRAAATIIGGLLLGVSRATIVEMSFLLAVPTMAAATGLDLLKTTIAFTGNEWALLGVGMLVSFIVALGAIRFLLNYIKKHNFIPFGIYRIAVGLLFLLV